MKKQTADERRFVWLADNNIANIKLARWNGTAWDELETIQTGGDNTNTLYESTAPSFSNFAIIGALSPSPSPAGTETVQPESPSSAVTVTPGTTEAPGFGGMTAILLLLLAARRKKKDHRT